MIGVSIGEQQWAKPRRGIGRGSIALLALAVCGCSSQGYPSLTRRPAERAVASPAPAAQPSAESGAPNPALAGKLAALLEQARDAHRRFTARQPAVDRTVAAAGTLGSESWASASIALAGLEDAHGGTTAVVIELDELATVRRIDRGGAADTGTEAIEAARDEVSQLVEEEAAALARLQARLGG